VCSRTLWNVDEMKQYIKDTINMVDRSVKNCVKSDGLPYEHPWD